MYSIMNHAQDIAPNATMLLTCGMHSWKHMCFLSHNVEPSHPPNTTEWQHSMYFRWTYRTQCTLGPINECIRMRKVIMDRILLWQSNNRNDECNKTIHYRREHTKIQEINCWTHSSDYSYKRIHFFIILSKAPITSVDRWQCLWL